MTNEQLVIRIKAGVDVAENMLQLWQQNQGYILTIAKRFEGYEEVEDLNQQGYIGLCHAVDGYDPEEGVPFISYAGFWIRQSMQRYIDECGSVVRLPVHMRGTIIKYKKMSAAFLAEYGREPTDQEACDYLGIGYKRLEELRQAVVMDNMGSLDVPIGEDGEGSAYDLLPGQDNMEADAVERMQQEQLRDTLWAMVDELPDQQTVVIRMKYLEEKSLKEAGEAAGLTASQARQMQFKALRALRTPHRARVLQSLMYGEIYSKALKGNGVEHFNQTWTSSTEYVALGHCW